MLLRFLFLLRQITAYRWKKLKYINFWETMNTLSSTLEGHSEEVKERPAFLWKSVVCCSLSGGGRLRLSFYLKQKRFVA